MLRFPAGWCVMARSKAQRERDREDLLLAIDELGHRAHTAGLALAMDTTYTAVTKDLAAMTRAGVVAQAYTDSHGWLWVRAGSLEADEQADVDDVTRQQWSWEEIS